MTTLSIAQLKSLAQQIGLSSSNATTAAAIAMAESGGRVEAQNPSGAAGLWQILPSAHPQYSVSRLLSDPVYNAQAMKAISSNGTNWYPWETYTNGMYRQYLSAAGAATGGGNVSSTPVKSGISNSFPMGQCTWWADQHYHDLTGYYVPWLGNAYQWNTGAQSSGWNVSATPPKGIPSIIIMQPNVQGASSLGHVGVVEKVNNNNTVTVSNMNWASGPVLQTVQGYPIRQTTISVGSGISFAWATGSGTSSSSTLTDFVKSTAKTFSLAPNADVTAFLASVDQYLQLTNPFDVQGAQQDSILGTTFTDPISWLSGFGSNLVGDIAALLIRFILIMLGIYLLWRVIANFVDFNAVKETTLNAGAPLRDVAAKVAPLIAAGV